MLSLSSMIILLQRGTSVVPNAFDHPVIIRLQRSLCRWGLGLFVMSGAVLACEWGNVQPHLMLPFMVMLAYFQGQPVSLPLLKCHRNQWWCFQQRKWTPVTLEPCYIGSWLMSMNIEGKNIIIWPDSCSSRAQWFLRRALLARQRALQEERPKPSRWRRLWQLILG